MNNPCPNCGFVGNNPNCRQHVTYWGVNPNLNLVPPPQASINWINSSSAELFAEIGRLNVLLNERNKEIEWLRGERPAVVAWLRRTSERMNDATLAHAADCIEDGEHRVEENE